MLGGCDLSRYDGIILSGRMKSIRSMNVENMRAVRFAHDNDKPLLGICYGAEIIVLALNGSLLRLERRIIGEEAVTIRKKNPLTDKKTLRVFESHGYYIWRLPEEFSMVADSGSCRYELIAHNRKPIFGTQFHPEVGRVSSDGREIIDNFVALTRR